jgi:hypothetical protein
MNALCIRFGTHARAIRNNGWLSVISVRGKSKIPDVLNWPSYGGAPPSDQQIEALVRPQLVNL